MVLQVEDRIRQIIPAGELETINDTVGVPSSFNMAFVPTDNVGGMDAEILISLSTRIGRRSTTSVRSATNCRRNFPAVCSISRPPIS